MDDIVKQLRNRAVKAALWAPIGSDCDLMSAAASEIEHLRLEIEVLRDYGNKDCTAMADAALKQKRETGKGPWED